MVQMPVVKKELVKVAPDPNSIICNRVEGIKPPPYTESYAATVINDLAHALEICNITADWLRRWAAAPLPQPDAQTALPAPVETLQPSP